MYGKGFSRLPNKTISDHLGSQTTQLEYYSRSCQIRKAYHRSILHQLYHSIKSFEQITRTQTSNRSLDKLTQPNHSHISLTTNMPSSPSLLTIPLELLWEIFDYVFAAEPIGDELIYDNGAIWPIPRTASLCKQLRAELLPLYFRHKTIWFSTLGEIGSALLLAPSTVPY